MSKYLLPLYISVGGIVYLSLRLLGADKKEDLELLRRLLPKRISFVASALEFVYVGKDREKNTKNNQKQLKVTKFNSTALDKTYGIPTTALRYFNVYGPRQALTNPYTGACAIFSNRILNNKPPYIFEDGNQQRDFINVRDLANANVLALEKSSANHQAINIGTGKPASIRRIADLLIKAYGKTKLKPYISQRYRKGDVRHCYADMTKARNLLGYEPTISLREGLKELAEWAKAHDWGAVDLFEKALKELKEKHLAA